MIGSLLEQLAVMFLMIGTGFLIRKKGIVSEKLQSDLSEVVMWVALPCSIIESGVLKTEANSAPAIFWISGLSVLSYVLMILIAECTVKLFKLNNEHGGLFASMTIFANTAFIGFPICSLLLGSKGVFYCSFYNMVFSLFFFTYGIRRISGKQGKGIISAFTQDPGMIATVVMVAVFIMQWTPPQFISIFLEGMSAMCTPLSMLVIGCMLTQVDLKEILKEKSYYLVSILRLGMIPITMLFVCILFSHLGVDKDILFTIIVLCAMPVGSLSAIYSQKYGKDTSYVSGGIMQTMLFFLLSLPLVIILSKTVLYGI